jgi:predicted DNA-binding protein YlxM (UPF0122 family)
MPIKKLQIEHEISICLHYKKGLTMKECGELFGITKQGVAYVLKKRGVKSHSRGYRRK